MTENEPAPRATGAPTQQEIAHHRWADDGGAIPNVEDHVPVSLRARSNPWVAVGVAAALGFACGFFSRR